MDNLRYLLTSSLILLCLPGVACLSMSRHDIQSNTNQQQEVSIPEPPNARNKVGKDGSGANNEPRSYTFSVPLVNAKPKPSNVFETFVELWNDPRPVTTSLLSNNDRSSVGSIIRESNGNDDGDTNDNNVENIPYCIISDKFEVESESFQVLLYPKGFTSSSTSSTLDELKDGSAMGYASAYLRYLPHSYGDEVDITWKLKLIDTRTSQALSVRTSGGLPRSSDTWSSGMTFCAETEAIESVGRATDWGSSTWLASEVCSALPRHLMAEIEVTMFDIRKGESSFAWPIGSKGGLGAVQRGIFESSPRSRERNFRVGEVIVPVATEDDPAIKEKLASAFIYPGVDYRVMTIASADGNAIFSTNSLSRDERQFARLALRPCGWKLQQQLWQKDGVVKDWPVEVEAGLLSSNTLTRFNPASAIPRISSAFKRDWLTYTLALILAISPIPLALLGRNAVSLYAIPSASMEPTLKKGDVILVEKLPRIYDRTSKGDVILFKPPQTLKDVIASNGGSPISSTSLFVKRVAGLPGDKNIKMDESTKDVTINGEPAAGPNRNLCDDEPLKLIDRLLNDGKGTSIAELGPNDVYVLGDCSNVSVDSRVFGPLDKKEIVGKPVSRIWPPSRISSAPF